MLDPQQHHAFDAARPLIDTTRANDIRRLLAWHHGGCLNLGTKKPDICEVTANEDRLIRALWQTLPGSSCWMSALFMLRHEKED